MRGIRLVKLVTRLAKAFDARLGLPAQNALPIDPALLPIDLAIWPKTR